MLRATLRGAGGGRLFASTSHAVEPPLLLELKNDILNANVQPFPNAPFTVPTYRNAPRTRHTGVETGRACHAGLRWAR